MFLQNAVIFLAILHSVRSLSCECENMAPFLQNLQGLSPENAVSAIIQPMAAVQNFWVLRERLLGEARTRRKPIEDALRFLVQTGSTNRKDLLITFLMVLNEYVVQEPQLQHQISRALYYLLKMKYLQRSDQSPFGVFGQCRTAPEMRAGSTRNIPMVPSTVHLRAAPAPLSAQTPVPVYHLAPTPHETSDCVCQKRILEYLINRLFTTPATPTNRVRSAVRKPEQNPGVHYKIGTIVDMMPKPQSDEEKMKYNKLLTLLNSTKVVGLLENLDFSKQKTPDEVVAYVLETILTITTTVETKELLIIYSQINNNRHTSFLAKIKTILKPRNAQEEGYFKVLLTILNSRMVFDVLNTDKLTGISEETRMILLLEHLLTITTFTSEERVVIQYYHDLLLRKTEYNFTDLLPLLEFLHDQKAQGYYQILKTFLTSNEVYQLMKPVNLKSLTNPEILSLVLRELITKSQNKEIVEAAIFFRNQLAIKNFGYNYFEALGYLAPGANIATRRGAGNGNFNNTLSGYFYTPEMHKVLSGIHFKGSTVGLEESILVLEGVERTTGVPEVKRAAHAAVGTLRSIRNYNNVLKIMKGNMPEAKTDLERQQIALVLQFLNSPEAYGLIKDVDQGKFPNGKLLLEHILGVFAKANLQEEQRKAISAVLDMSLRLNALEFITRKEIKRSFKLNEIFTDTFDQATLNLQQKEVFDKFFKYLSSIKPEVISKFGNWDQAKTRGEFVHLLFKFLANEADVPAETKDFIVILEPLIKMEGKGALPPY